MTLTVPRPEVTVDGINGTQFVAEKPMKLTCGTVAFPDGSELVPEQAQRFGFRLFRKLSNGNMEVWDQAGEGWMSESTVPELESLAFMDELWQNMLVAMGQQDQGSCDKFATDRSSGFPKYHVRCLFSAIDADGTEHEGTSPASADFTVYAAGELDRAGLVMDPEEITKATEIRLFLKDKELLAERGVVAIREQGGGFEIALTAAGASVRINSSGDVQVSPATGRNVQMAGDVAVDGALTVQDSLNVSVTVSGAGVRINNSGDIQLSPAAGRSVQLQGDVSVDGALSVENSPAIGFAVSGASVRLVDSGDIELSPADGRSVILQGDVTIDGALTVQDNLTVQGQAVLQGGVEVSGDLDVSGAIRVNGHDVMLEP